MGTEQGLVADIECSVVMTRRVVEEIREDQWASETPCQGWTVREVLNHVVGGMRIFASQVAGEEPEADHESDWLGTDPRTAYTTAADADVYAWTAPGALEGTVTISLGQLPAEMGAVIHLVEVLVHGIDLAVATGQECAVDEGLCERVLDLLRGMGGVDAYRVPGVFGPEVVTDPASPAHQQLAGYLGRDLVNFAAHEGSSAR